MSDRQDLSPGSAEPQNGGLGAMGASLVMHVILLIIFGLLWSRTPRGTGEESDRPVGIAMVHRMPDRDQYLDVAELEQVDNQTEASESAASAEAAPPADMVPPLDLAGAFQEMTEAPSPVSGTGLAGDNELDGDALGTAPGQGASNDPSKRNASLFGVSGFGSRFVYVVDRSDSMNGFGGRPLAAAKKEMIRSLGTLTHLQQFQVIFYNDTPTSFRASSNAIPFLMEGSEANVNQAQRYVRSVRAYGGTQHSEALRMALRMKPDVIFFLTDARVPRLLRSYHEQITRRASRDGITIHTVEFGTDLVAPKDSFLIDLAKANGGQYQYINVQEF